MTAPAPLIPVCLKDYERLAAARLSDMVWAYLDSGAGDEVTLRANAAAFDRLRLAPRVLADLREANTRVTFLGHILDHPILIAPVAHQRLFHPEGEAAMAAGAGAAKAAMVVSTQASLRIEDIADASRGPLFFQLYIQPDRDFTLALVARAQAAGYAGLMVTVDAPASLRPRERRAGFHLPAGLSAVNLEGMEAPEVAAAPIGESPLFSGFLSQAPRWEDIAWLRRHTRMPVILKGILTADDARRARDCGVDAIAVSNHGARVLDTVPASIEALPAIADALGGTLPLLLDGGVRRGTDILKALALGATAIMIGRPAIHALACGGAPGVAHMVHLLRAELELAMALTGRPTLAELDPSLFWRPLEP